MDPTNGEIKLTYEAYVYLLENGGQMLCRRGWSRLSQESIKSSLVAVIFQSILLSEQEELEKPALQDSFQNFLVCENTNSGDICMECKNCLSIDNNNFIDLIEIDAASNTMKVRELIDNTQYLPCGFRGKDIHH